MRQDILHHGRILNTGDNFHRCAAVLASPDVVRWPIRYKDMEAGRFKRNAPHAIAAKMDERRSSLDFRIRNRTDQWNPG
jgi:hypothetical protein